MKAMVIFIEKKKFEKPNNKKQKNKNKTKCHFQGSANLINKRQVRSGWNEEVGGQTVHLTENLISINFLQMSCVITWAQKKFSLQPQKKK